MSFFFKLLAIIVLILMVFFGLQWYFDTTTVCGNDGKTYTTFKQANNAGVQIIALQQCTQVGVATTFGNQTQPVLQPTIPQYLYYRSLQFVSKIVYGWNFA